MKSTIEKSFASRQNAVIKAEKLAERITRKLQFDESDRMDIAIAVTEAVNNAVEHGNRLSSSKFVTVRFEFSNRILRIIVRDQGDGFALREVDDPLAPENLTKPNGRGLLILDSLMDSVEVKPSPQGTEVVMIKNR